MLLDSCKGSSVLFVECPLSGMPKAFISLVANDVIFVKLVAFARRQTRKKFSEFSNFYWLLCAFSVSENNACICSFSEHASLPSYYKI